MDRPESQEDVTLQPDIKETPEVAKLLRDAKASALADVGRTMAEAQKALKASEAAEKRVTQMLKDYEEDIRDDPDKLTAFRTRQEKQRVEDELALRDSELNEAKERLRLIDEEKAKSTKEQNAREIATRLGVDEKKLIKYALLTDGTPEAIEDIAKDLPKVKPDEPLTPDSNMSTGGSQSEEQIRKNYRENPNDPRSRAEYYALRAKKGW